HINCSTTYRLPTNKELDDDPPPQPRIVTLKRDKELGFGFVAGSDRPVIVRFVKEGGPSEFTLQAGDQIYEVNGHNVRDSPREHVIELIKSSEETVTLVVCQPNTQNSIRKSALLTAAKKARLRSNPSRVRFAEGV
ncbi:FERM and PDZ domain-containing protein 4-like protein, partial [Euroglyphus maynei]